MKRKGFKLEINMNKLSLNGALLSDFPINMTKLIKVVLSRKLFYEIIRI